MNSKTRISELDSLRGIAAIAVMLYHYTVRFSDKFNTDIISKHFVFDYGKYGVELFFTLSGFVIYMSLGSRSEPLKFVKKRFIRLYPTFWICLFITYIVTSFWGPTIMKVSLKDFLMNVTMLPSIFNSKSVDGVYWTLKIEIFFYLTILIILILNFTNKIKELGFIYLTAGLVIILLSKLYVSPTSLSLSKYYYYGSLFLCGINFYFIKTLGYQLWNKLQILFAFILSLSFGLENSIVYAAVISIFFLLVYKKLTFLSISPLIFLGKISYALYLIHQNIGYTIQCNLIEFGLRNYFLLIIIPFINSIILAWIITFFAEILTKAIVPKPHPMLLSRDKK